MANEVLVSSNNDKKEQIRVILASLYDMQKLRIATGNRLVSSFYIKLGIKPSTKPDDADKDTVSFIATLRREYKKVTDAIKETEKVNGVTSNAKTVLKKLQNSKDENDRIQYIGDQYDYKLIESYEKLCESEEELLKVLEQHVKSHPLWDAFFKNVKGAGVTMAGCCIAYLDPYKARHVSSFFKYAGIDTVQNKDDDGEFLFLAAESIGTSDLGTPILQRTNQVVRQKFYYEDQYGEKYTGKVTDNDEYDMDGNKIYYGVAGEVLTKIYVERKVDGELVQVYEDVETGAEYIGNVVRYEHGRRKGDTEMFEYTKKDGTIGVKRGITYNPVLKSKLLGVLAGCIIKAKDDKYATIYYDYKGRLDSSAWHAETSAGVKHKMALRYMIKQFLRDLWTTWRQLEGLPVDAPYEVAKLGHKPHKYNEYQCRCAEGCTVQ